MREIDHVFGPGETVKGIIRKFNGVTVPGEIMELLWDRFTEINPTNKVPKVGELYKIPVYKENGAAPITNEFALATPTPKETTLPKEDKETPTTPLIPEKEDKEMKPHQDDAKAMLDRQKRRELARGELPKEYKLKQETPSVPHVEKPVKAPPPIKEVPQETKSPEVTEVKEEQPKPRKKRKVVNPTKPEPKVEVEPTPKVETKEQDDEAERIEKIIQAHAKPRTIQRNYRDLRKRRH